jgi:hypothetical protein
MAFRSSQGEKRNADDVTDWRYVGDRSVRCSRCVDSACTALGTELLRIWKIERSEEFWSQYDGFVETGGRGGY